MTLTFLILAGQVKVKGQLGEMAKCVEDDDDKIREMSRMFFAELAGKDNAVYNHFVDMFSLLSSDEGLDEDRFRRIIKFLASFIEKVSIIHHPRTLTMANEIHRTSTPNSSLASWLPDWRELRVRGNGMTSPTPWACCRIRTRRSRSSLVRAARLSRVPLLDRRRLNVLRVIDGWVRSMAFLVGTLRGVRLHTLSIPFFVLSQTSVAFVQLPLPVS
jgi:hypothetical protein